MKNYYWICDVLRDMAEFTSISGLKKTNSSLCDALLTLEKELADFENSGIVEGVNISKKTVSIKYAIKRGS